MSASFQSRKPPVPTRHNNPCHVCGDTSGNCRTSTTDATFFQCQKESGSRKGEVINGYKNIGHSKCGTWGLFKPVGNWQPDTRPVDERRAEKALQEALERQHEQAVNARRMPVAERHEHYSDILSQLRLHPDDRADAKRRGFSDEEISKFKSVERDQKLTGTYPLNLPGIAADGRSLANGVAGYLCPALDAEGKIQGFQIRNRHHNGEGAKYVWLSSNEKFEGGLGAHLPNGELPVGVHWPDELRVFDRVGIAENFAIKPQIAANRLGMVVIGCDAANLTSRPDNFKQALIDIEERLCQLKAEKDSEDSKDLSTPGKALQPRQPSSSQTTSVALSRTSTSSTQSPFLAKPCQDGSSISRKKQQHSTTLGLNQRGQLSGPNIPDGNSIRTACTQKNLTRVTYIADAGDTSNQQVMPRIKRQYEFLKRLGLEIDFLWWGQRSKAAGDIDEISDEQLEQAKLISWPEFWAKNESQPVRRIESDKPVTKSTLAELQLAAQVPNVQMEKPVKKVIRHTPTQIAKNIDPSRDKLPKTKIAQRIITHTPAPYNPKGINAAQWKEQKELERDIAAYRLAADLYPDSQNWEKAIRPGEKGYKQRAKAFFFLKIEKVLIDAPGGKPIIGFVQRMERPEAGRSLHAYNCSKATGKSSGAIVPELLDCLREGQRSLVVVPSRALAKEFAERINTVCAQKVAMTHLEKDYKQAKIIVTCGESVYKLKNIKFDFIAIDEVNEVAERSQSGQLGKAPRASRRAFGELLRKAQRVTIATDDMYRVSLRSITRLGRFASNEVQVQRVIRNSTGMEIIVYGSFGEWLAVAANKIKQGKKVCIPCGSQTKARIIDRELRKLFPEKRGFVVDGKDSFSGVKINGDIIEGTKAEFLKSPDAFIEKWQPDWLIFTPVINSGVSMETDYFDAQFEYASPCEGATQIAQRGERLRLALGRTGKIQQRHIFFSMQGAPTLESAAWSLSVENWQKILANQNGAPAQSARTFAKRMGFEKALADAEFEARQNLSEKPELAEFLAIRSYDAIFKRERLEAEWRRYGWKILDARLTAEEQSMVGEIKKMVVNLAIDLDKQRGRTLKLARVRSEDSDEEEATNPFQAVRQQKAHLEEMLSAEFLQNQDGEFYTSWFTESSREKPTLGAIGRGDLFRFALEEPETFKKIRQLRSIRLLARKPNFEAGESWCLPELPVSARDLRIVELLLGSEVLREIASERLSHWTNYDQLIDEGKAYLITISDALGAVVINPSSGEGIQFTEGMTAADCIRKALELLGFRTAKRRETTAGDTGKRLNIHHLVGDYERLGSAMRAIEEIKKDLGLEHQMVSLESLEQCESDADEKALFEQAKAKAWEEARTGENARKIFKAECELKRAQTFPMVRQALHEQMMKKVRAMAQAADEVEKAIASLEVSRPELPRPEDSLPEKDRLPAV